MDTAPAYGSSEQRLGRLLRQSRADWVICTKVGESFDGTTSRHDFTPDAVIASVHNSLKRLQTDYLDIVLIHSDGNDEDILLRHGTLQTLIALRNAGKIRCVGMSHKSPEGAALAVEQGADVLMATLNRSYMDECAVIVRAAAAGVGILIKKALASGHADPEDLTFVARQRGVHCIVVGTTSSAHLKDNAQRLMTLA